MFVLSPLLRNFIPNIWLCITFFVHHPVVEKQAPIEGPLLLFEPNNHDRVVMPSWIAGEILLLVSIINVAHAPRRRKSPEGVVIEIGRFSYSSAGRTEGSTRILGRHKSLTGSKHTQKLW